MKGKRRKIEKLKFDVIDDYTSRYEGYSFIPCPMGGVRQLVGVFVGTKIEYFEATSINQHHHFTPNKFNTVIDTSSGKLGIEILNVINCVGKVFNTFNMYSWGAISFISTAHCTIGYDPIMIERIKESEPRKYVRLMDISRRVRDFNNKSFHTPKEVFQNQLNEYNRKKMVQEEALVHTKEFRQYLVFLKEKHEKNETEVDFLFTKNGIELVSHALKTIDKSNKTSILGHGKQKEFILTRETESSEVEPLAKFRNIDEVITFFDELVRVPMAKIARYKSRMKRVKKNMRELESFLRQYEEDAKKLPIEYLEVENFMNEQLLRDHELLESRFLDFFSRDNPHLDTSSPDIVSPIHFGMFQGTEISTLMKIRPSIIEHIIKKNPRMKKVEYFSSYDSRTSQQQKSRENDESSQHFTLNIRVFPDFFSTSDAVLVYRIKQKNHEKMMSILRKRKYEIEEKFLKINHLIGSSIRTAKQEIIEKIEEESKKIRSEFRGDMHSMMTQIHAQIASLRELIVNQHGNKKKKKKKNATSTTSSSNNIVTEESEEEEDDEIEVEKEEKRVEIRKQEHKIIKKKKKEVKIKASRTILTRRRSRMSEKENQEI